VKIEYNELFYHSNRLRHLGLLWDELRQKNELPQVDKWLSDKFRSSKQYGSKDRKILSDGIFLIIRLGPWILQDLLGSEFTSKVPTPLTLWKKLQTVEFSSLKVQLLRILEQIDHDGSKENSLNSPLMSRLIHPWVMDALKRREEKSHWQIEKWLTMQNTRAPLWVRLNDPDQEKTVRELLQKDGFVFQKTENSFRVSGNKGIYANESFTHGLIEIQDLASQKLGELFNPQPSEIIWDTCAGGGGKTIQIASMLKNKGAIIATDIRTWKLEEVKKRAKKAQYHNIRTMPWDASEELVLPREARLRGGFDRILVDAPCTSSGTWRRNPDSQYRLDENKVKDLSQLQLKILTQASKSLRGGGILAYSTCSFLVEENEDVIDSFLANNPMFTLETAKMVGAPDHDADSMFMAILSKKK